MPVLRDADKDRAEQVSFPDWVEPMLATLTHETFSSEDWIFERKLDGERCLAFFDGDGVRLLSRNRKELNDTYPELEETFAEQKTPCVVDGEIVAFEGGVTSFSRLQQRMQLKDREEARQSNVAVHFYLFDVLWCEGYDVRQVPQRRRKQLLRSLLQWDEPLRFTPHRNGEGEAYHDQACKKGWEGIIAKDGSAPYKSDRSRSWLKFKCVHRQELVIGGYTEPEGERIGFGALLVGYYEDDALHYAGKVGTGYDEDLLRNLSTKLESLERDAPPFAGSDAISRKGVHWVEPELVGEVGFTEWTEDGKLRHPRFLGLRRDKDPEDVVREDNG